MVATLATTLLAALASGCGETSVESLPSPTAQPPRLTAADARAPTDEPTAPAAGTLTLEFPAGRALLFVPPGLDPAQPGPLTLMLHGTGQDPQAILDAMRPLAERDGRALLIPSAADRTWDVIVAGYGPDYRLIDAAMSEALATVPVDRDRLSVTGFSDGGAYALALGLANGDLFGEVLAIAPSKLPFGPREGKPAILVVHGTDDPLVSVDSSRELVRRLEGQGYDIRLQEFDGGHEMPLDLVEQSF
jgi:predicted esterase